MWEILSDLFLGDRGDASDRERLRKRGITHIVNCSKELPCRFEGEFEYLWLRMEDPDPAFAEKIPVFCRFIDGGRRQGKVMVHCTGGVSRSPAVILAYLCHLDGNLEAAAARLSRAVPTGIDKDFFYPLARFHGGRLMATDIKALQQKLLGRACFGAAADRPRE
ncbi:MAG TPA: dual specificity protein phosphatase family protein [Gemmataceae bacterium]|nr:dual specificity protein phosphatase family protein [Gemmataceae bacterium]